QFEATLEPLARGAQRRGYDDLEELVLAVAAAKSIYVGVDDLVRMAVNLFDQFAQFRGDLSLPRGRSWQLGSRGPRSSEHGLLQVPAQVRVGIVHDVLWVT